MNLGSHNLELGLSAEIIKADGSIAGVYKNLENKAQQPKLENNIELVTRDKKGNITSTKRIPFRSFNQNFIATLYSGFSMNKSNSLAKKVNGSNVTDLNYPQYEMDGQIGDSTRGIVVGTDGTAVSLTDYDLIAPIDHGAAAGQLEYQQTIHQAPVVEGSGYKYVIRRIFANNSGSGVTINEVGLRGINAVYSSDNILLARDVVDINSNPINFTIPDGQTAEIKYNLYINGVDGIVVNFLYMLFAAYRDGDFTGVSTSGGSVTFQDSDTNSWAVTPNYPPTTNTSSYGVVVGTGTTAYTVDDTSLETRIAYGSAAGQLTHTVITVEPINVVGNVATFQIHRNFTNDTAGAITINEVGIYHASGFMSVRTVLGTPITVQPTETVRFIYTFRIAT